MYASTNILNCKERYTQAEISKSKLKYGITKLNHQGTLNFSV